MTPSSARRGLLGTGVVLKSVSQQKLQHARTELEEAVTTADDGGVRDALRETAGAFAGLTVGDRDPDPNVLDGHLNVLRQAREESTDDTEERIDRALEYAEAYRETLDTV